MTKFPENEHFKLLVILHNLGLLTLPNYYEAEWKNWVHRNCYRNGVFLLHILFVTCQTMLTFRYAVHELSQFLQRLLECFAFQAAVPIGIILNMKVESTITLLRKMDTEFSSGKQKVHIKYRRKKLFILTSYGALFVILFFFIIIDSLMPSQKTVHLMERLYHRTEPVRLLPVMIFTPIIDTNQLTTFIIIYVLELYLLVIIAIMIAQLMVMELVFTLAIACQFEILFTYVKLLGAEHRNKEGRLIQFTDLVHGVYCKVDDEQQAGKINEKKSPNSIIRQNRRRALEAFNYERVFLGKIVSRQQELMSFLNLYSSILVPVIDSVTFYAIGATMISVYQIIIMTNLPPLTQIKITCESITVALGLFNLLNESERVNSTFVSLAQSLYGSQWYGLLSRDSKRSVCFMLRFCQRGKYIVNMSGLLVLNRQLFLRIIRHTYSFANFMKLRSRY